MSISFKQKISRENKYRVDDCYPAMLKHWVEQGTPTWSGLAEALESNVMHRNDIASDIRSEYKIVQSTKKDIQESLRKGNTSWLLLLASLQSLS